MSPVPLPVAPAKSPVPPTILHTPWIQPGFAVLCASSEFPGSSMPVVAPCVTSVLPFSNQIVRSVQPSPHPLKTSTVRSTCPSPATFPAPQTVSGAQPLSTKIARNGTVVLAAAGATSANAATRAPHASASLTSFMTSSLLSQLSWLRPYVQPLQKRSKRPSRSRPNPRLIRGRGLRVPRRR